MTTHTIIGYSADALIFDPNTGSFQLDPNYNANDGRVRLEINDDDTFFDGDREADEVGEDFNQTGNVYDMDGNLVSSGKIYVEQFATLQAPDGSMISIDRVEIGGGKVAYLPTQPFQPGVVYSVVSEGNVDDTNRDPSHDGDDGGGDYDSRMQYNQYNDVPCFAAGMMVQTQTGPVAVELLKEGDVLVTRDHGLQPVLRVILTSISGPALAHNPDLRPVTFAAVDGFKPLTVSPKHRMMLEGWEVEMLFGDDAVLAQANHLKDQDALAQWLKFGVCYVHVVLPEHAVIDVEGQWCESYFVSAKDEVIADDDWSFYTKKKTDPVKIKPHDCTALRTARFYEIQALRDYKGDMGVNHAIGHFPIRTTNSMTLETSMTAHFSQAAENTQVGEACHKRVALYS